MTAAAELRISRTATGVALWIQVTPRARRPSVGGIHANALRVAVSEPPVAGAANAACVRAIARALKVRGAAIELDPASRGRRKRVRIDGNANDLTVQLRRLAGVGRSD